MDVKLNAHIDFDNPRAIDVGDDILNTKLLIIIINV
jgi:hypothetical protein